MTRISATQRNSNKPKCGMIRGLSWAIGLWQWWLPSTISWDLVPLVTVCLHTLKRRGHISLHWNAHTQLQLITTREIVLYPVQWTLCKQFRAEKKNTNAVIKSSSGHKVFSAPDLKLWSDYRSPFTVIMSKAVLKSLLCVPLCGVDRHIDIIVSLDWNMGENDGPSTALLCLHAT